MPGWLKSLLTLSSSNKFSKPNLIRRLNRAFPLSLPVLLVLFIFHGVRKSRHADPPTNKQALITGASRDDSGIKQTAEILYQKKFYEALTANSPLAIVALDLGHKITSCNPAFLALFGYTQAEVIGFPLDELITNEETRNEAAGYSRQVSLGHKIHATGQRCRKDGSLVEVEIFGVPVIVDDTQVGILGLYNDITQRRQAEEALQAAKEQAELLYKVVPSAIFTVDTHRRITSINAKAAEMIGYAPEELIGEHCTLFASGFCTKGCGLYDPRILKPIMGAECTIQDRTGEKRTVIKNADLLRSADGSIIGGVESFEDISDRKRAEESLKYLATHDPLTGLPNRTLFYDRLGQALLQSQRSHPQGVAVMFLDLDGFKAVNDSLGHEKGDRLLVSIADRLRNTLRESDTVARLGGDEFGFVFENIANPIDVANVARKILTNLRKPILLDHLEISVTATIGISLAPEDGQDAESLIKRADTAMYLAKEAGRDNFQFFSKPAFPEGSGMANKLMSGIQQSKGN